MMEKEILLRAILVTLHLIDKYDRCHETCCVKADTRCSTFVSQSFLSAVVEHRVAQTARGGAAEAPSSYASPGLPVV